MQMSTACTAPIQPRIEPRDTTHPLYGEYMSYRNAMNAQLVVCLSFSNWLAQRAWAAEADSINTHPRLEEYRKYMRSYHDKNGTHIGEMSFDEYLLSV